VTKRKHRCLHYPRHPHHHILPRRRGAACWRQRGLHKHNEIGAQGLHAISLPTGYIGLFAGVQFISCWLVVVTGEVGWFAKLPVWNRGGGAGAKRRKIETRISALDLLELLLGFLHVLHAAGGGAFVRVPPLQSN
jgi:hypothetical protein